jgi:uncharacterized membrane protein
MRDWQQRVTDIALVSVIWFLIGLAIAAFVLRWF